MAAKLQRIAAPDLPNPATPEEPHRVVPHLLHDQDDGYQDLLELLRRDLQPNPSTDLVPPALASAENKPWSIDIGTGSFVFSAAVIANPSISHRLGRPPVFAAAVPVLSASQAQLVVSLYPAPTATQVSFYATTWNQAAVTQTTTFYWMVIG